MSGPFLPTDSAEEPNFNAGAGNNQYANNLVVVPEPGSFMIIGAGLALASLRRLTSKRRAA